MCTTAAAKSSPTAAMETTLNQPPLDTYTKEEARVGAHRVKRKGNCRTSDTSEHARIVNQITNSTFKMSSDAMIPKPSFDKIFKVDLVWDEWRVK